MLKRTLAASVLLALLVGWFGLLGPRQLGGPATYVSVVGFSMEPTLFGDDLVVLRERPDYAVGDVVAYPVEGGYVIHRIVGGDPEGGFTLQGDNRNRIDEARPTRSQIAGELWLHLPGAGGWLQQIRQPFNFGVFAMALALLAGIGGTELRRRRRKRSRRMRRPNMPEGRPVPAQADSGQPARWWSGDRQPEWYRAVPSLVVASVAVGVILATLFATLAVISFRSTAERTEYVERLQYAQSASLDYEVEMELSSLYPAGVFRPAGASLNEAAFQGVAASATVDSFSTRLARTLEVTVHYELGSDAFVASAGAPESLTGELSAVLEIQAGRDGWTQVRPLIGAQAFTGNSVDATATVSIPAITRLVEQVEEETGITPATYQLRVVPTVELFGTVRGESISEVFEPAFTFNYNRTQITTQARLVTAEPRSIGSELTSSEAMTLLGVKTTVLEARRLSILGLGIALMLAGVGGALLYFGIGHDEDAHIRNRYRSRLVAVAASGSPYARETIRLASIHDLARVADRSGGLILVEEASGHRRYFVPDGDEVYEYRTVRRRRSGRQTAAVRAG